MAKQNLVPWHKSTLSDSFASFSSLQKEMNRMFNNIWSTPTSSPEAMTIPDEATGFFYPDIEMAETDGHVEVSVELPGVTEKDINVVLSPDGKSLSIKGEKKVVTEKKEKDYYFAERSYGSFRRTMSLPTQVSPDGIDAQFKNGVLAIKLTKLEDTAQGAKHIKITT